MMGQECNGRAVTLITPTYRNDLDRFRLQRESIERCGINIPHVAVVHTEDMALFRDVPHRRNLTVVSTRQVLGASLDRRRRAWGVRRLNPLHWVVRKPVHGWTSQQLVKLMAGDVAGTDGIVCLDSDVLFFDRVTEGDFFADDGRLHLYETSAGLDAEMAHWLGESLRFLRVPLRGQALRKYTHQPMCFDREVCREMREHIARVHGSAWHDAFIAAGVTECTTYGVFAREVHQLRRVAPVEPVLTVNFWWPAEVERFEETFLPRVVEGREKMVLVQSNAGRAVAEIRPLVERAWELRRRQAQPA